MSARPLNAGAILGAIPTVCSLQPGVGTSNEGNQNVPTVVDHRSWKKTKCLRINTSARCVCMNTLGGPADYESSRIDGELF